ncbi:Omp28-related outer membrane protein, partial [Alistipes putredinis]|uniref:Omp28-related outer membrane protein n=1 Tax=Alistipes putredinis TaxID=28117 RepID=UPI003AB42070
MKWHFNFFRFAVVCAVFVALAGFMACSDDDSESGPELVLSASTSSLAGGGSVTFTVAFEDRDVTAEAVIKNVTSGSEVQNATWTTNVAGTYEFQAAYDGMLSNVVSVKVESDSESDAFYRHVLLTKFTATWCGPCAQAQRYFEQLKPEESERFLVVAAHQGDRLTVPVGSALGAKLGYQYVPTWNYDFRTVFESVGTGGITATSIRNQIKSAMEEYPAVCGVKAESELDGQTAKIRATVRFQQAGNYKIACVLTENDIQKTNNETL